MPRPRAVSRTTRMVTLPDWLFAMNGDHEVQPAKPDHRPFLHRDQLRDSLIRERLQSPFHAGPIDGVTEESDEFDDLWSVLLARFANDRHNVSRMWIRTPTRPPTKVPLMRMYWRSRPTAASRRAVTVRASQVRTVSETSLTIELP